MIKPDSTYFVQMTPALAQKWIEEYRYQKQRILRKWRVNQIAASMSAGEWIPAYPMQICWLNGRRICTDGQHRQNAVIESGTTQTFTVIELLCDSEADVERVYYKTDRNLTRNTSDIYRTISLADDLGMTNREVARFGSAITSIYSNFSNVSNSTGLSDEHRLELMREFGESAGIYFEAMTNTQELMRDRLYRASVIGVGIATIRYAPRQFGPDKVRDFWRGIADGDLLRRGDPRYVAREHLLTTSIGHGKSGKSVTSEYQARYIASCFNAWVDNRMFATERGGPKVDASAPITICGTPWNGKQQEVQR